MIPSKEQIEKSLKELNSCPRDADDSILFNRVRMCLARIPGKGKYDLFFCTRFKGHNGLHHAHAHDVRTGEDKCVATFTDEEALVEAL